VVWSVDLPPEPSSATRARRLVREQLASICAPDALDVVALLVTELVTNAILHARTPLQLQIETRPGHVRLCVGDTSDRQPEVRTYATDAVTGRGLALVETLASSWGVNSTPTGKVVWCEIPL
jgi:anti-sigma regulatory factor (Ser/Thr protein kinase)